MGIEVHKTKTKGKCTCFYFPETKDTDGARLCFRRNFVGALDEPQIKAHCDMKHSDIFDASSTKVQNILRTMKQFQTGVAKAQMSYWGDDVVRDMDVWRDKVSKAVKDIEVEINVPAKDEARLAHVLARSLEREIERTPLRKEERRYRRKHQDELDAEAIGDIRRIVEEARARQKFLTERQEGRLDRHEED